MNIKYKLAKLRIFYAVQQLKEVQIYLSEQMKKDGILSEEDILECCDIFMDLMSYIAENAKVIENAKEQDDYFMNIRKENSHDD